MYKFDKGQKVTSICDGNFWFTCYFSTVLVSETKECGGICPNLKNKIQMICTNLNTSETKLLDVSGRVGCSKNKSFQKYLFLWLCPFTSHGNNTKPNAFPPMLNSFTPQTASPINPLSLLATIPTFPYQA